MNRYNKCTQRKPQAKILPKILGCSRADIIHHVLGILKKGEEIDFVNKTHIVLIPKKKTCEPPVDFRPISLCNVLYKLVAKVLANSLKKVLPDIIHESQSGLSRVGELLIIFL